MIVTVVTACHRLSRQSRRNGLSPLSPSVTCARENLKSPSSNNRSQRPTGRLSFKFPQVTTVTTGASPERCQLRQHWPIPEKESRPAAGAHQSIHTSRPSNMRRQRPTTTGSKFTVRGQVYIQTGAFFHAMSNDREVRVLELERLCPDCSQTVSGHGVDAPDQHPAVGPPLPDVSQDPQRPGVDRQAGRAQDRQKESHWPEDASEHHGDLRSANSSRLPKSRFWKSGR